MTADKNKNELLKSVLPRYETLLSPEDYAKLLAAINKPLHPAIRLNLLKIDPQKAIKQLAEKYQWTVEPIPFCNDGWWVKDAQTEPGKTIEHRLGHYYIQDAASMLPVSLFDFKDSDSPLILDMAASPGGKTIHLISRTMDQGLVIANDSSRSRLTALRLVLQNWSAINKAVTNLPGERFGHWYPRTFDYVLLDAPCSMESLRSLESHPMRPISEKERQNLATRQKRLLESAIKTVRIGGQVVYATCTLAPEEDEAVLNDLLTQYAHQVNIESVHDRLGFKAMALIRDGSIQFDPDVSNAVRLWPHISDTSGFFAALITKSEEIEVEGIDALNKDQNRNRALQKLSKKSVSLLSDELQEDYGFKIEKILSDHDCLLMSGAKEVVLIPARLLKCFGSLSFTAAGIKLGEYHPRGFLLSHEFASRFYSTFTKGVYILPQEYHPAWLRGEDLRNKPIFDVEKGEVVVLTDNQQLYLGLGRILADRTKNLLPKRIVL